MFVDIVIPKNNEKKLVESASKLGIQGLCFLYTSYSDAKKIGKVKSKIPVFAALLKKKAGITIANLGKHEVVFGEETERIIGFSFSAVNKSKNFPGLIKRTRQTIKLCRKRKKDMLIASLASTPFEMRSIHELKSLFMCLGMNPGEAKKATSLAADLLSGKRDYKGVEIIQ